MQMAVLLPREPVKQNRHNDIVPHKSAAYASHNDVQVIKNKKLILTGLKYLNKMSRPTLAYNT